MLRHCAAVGGGSQRCTCPFSLWSFRFLRERSTPRGAPSRRRKLEVLELEGRRHGASDERPLPEGPRCLPLMRGDDDLRSLIGHEVRAENVMFHFPSLAVGRELDRRTAVEVPNLRHVHTVPVRKFTGTQKMIDRSTGATRLTVTMSPGLSVVAALGMPNETKCVDDVPRIHEDTLAPRADLGAQPESFQAREAFGRGARSVFVQPPTIPVPGVTVSGENRTRGLSFQLARDT